MRLIRPISSIAVALLASATTLAAQEWMYATGNGGSSIIKINLSTGAATTIGPSLGGGETFAGAFTSDGSFWTLNGGFGNARFASVNLATGQTTDVGGPTGLSNTMALAGRGMDMYAASWDGRFWKVNTSTGNFSFVGNMGFGNIMDMATSTTGRIIATNGVSTWSIDHTTGASTLLWSGWSGMPMGLAFDSNDNLYATTWEGSSMLYSVNQTTGALTHVGALGVSYAHGGDVFHGAVVPEPATVVLTASGLIVLLGAARARGRRSVV